MSQEVILALKVLLTGFVVVFSVLLLLIAIIKIYGTIVYNIETGAKKSKKEKAEQKSKETPAAKQINTTPLKTQPQSEGVPEEVVAVIAAAVIAMYGSENKVRIKSIAKSPSSRSNWAMAGIIDNTRPF